MDQIDFLEARLSQRRIDRKRQWDEAINLNDYTDSITIQDLAWTHNQAKEIRESLKGECCDTCKNTYGSKVWPTDWNFTGCIIRRTCEVCKTVTFIGPAEVLARIANVETICVPDGWKTFLLPK